MTLRVVELFSGIGAQRMALTLAGIPHEVVAIAEINKHSLASYKAIYGDCPNLGDITKIERLPPCDLLTYSFPCQDLSLAGNRAGMGEGTRSGLVWEVVRLLESAERERPEWLLMENVPQVLTAPEWPALVGRLEAMGYRNKWAKLDSSDFGSAQKRVRVFMVSRLDQVPPELPLSAPNAPRLCLRDIMEPERADRYVKRIPLDRVKWRAPKTEVGKSSPTASLDGETFYSKAMLYSSSSPTVRTDHGKNSRIKVIKDRQLDIAADYDGKEWRMWRCIYKDESVAPTLPKRLNAKQTSIKVVDRKPGQSTPLAEVEGVVYYPERSLYSSSGSSPTVCTDHGNNRIQVVEGIKEVASWQREGRYRMANAIFSDEGNAPTVVQHGGGDRDIKVIADDGSMKFEQAARIYSDEGSMPTITDIGRRGAKYFRIAEGGKQSGDDLVVSILTPRECWRLMGFPEWAYFRAARVSSETQLYNQAGNSIVVEVLMAIFNAMFRPQKYAIQKRITEAVA